MAWITGYDGWSFYVHQGVILTHEHDPVWWGRAQDQNGALRTVWMDPSDVTSYTEGFIQADHCHPMQDLAGKLADLGHGTSRIGVEMENYYFSAKAYTTLRDSLPGASIEDATALINWQRAVKSSEEIGFMQKAARISERLIDVACERIEPGLKKNELVADIQATAIRGVGDTWGDYPAIVPLLSSGKDAAAPHLTWTGDPFVQGEATFFELAGCYRRYHVPLCRTVFLGTPPEEMRRAEDALVEGIDAGIEAAKPGNRASDVADALGRALERAGISRSARCGYPIGLSYPPDWGERTISFRAEDQTILEPGMTFHFMPGLWMDGWGMAITEPIMISKNGSATCFCDRPRELYIKP